MKQLTSWELINGPWIMYTLAFRALSIVLVEDLVLKENAFVKKTTVESIVKKFTRIT